MKHFLPGDINAGDAAWYEKQQLNLVEISYVVLGRTKVRTQRVNPELFRVVAR